MPEEVKVTTNEARQATTRPKTMIWVLLGSLYSLRDGGLGPSHGVDQSSGAFPVTGTFPISTPRGGQNQGLGSCFYFRTAMVKALV